MTSVYIVRCNFTAPEKEQAWNAWYSGPKLKQMLAQPYFLSCQRFRRAAGAGRDYLALWVVQKPEALNTRQYVSQWGFAEWEAYVADWSRDLFDGGNRTAQDFAIASGGELEVIAFDGMSADDAAAARQCIAAPNMMWLPIVGLDHHTPLIGLRAVYAVTANNADTNVQYATYRPICNFQTSAPE
jgi:hypothetical protein